MLGSITPLGERGRNQRWGVTVAALALGSVAAGAGLGAILGWAGERLPAGEEPLWVLAGLVALGAALDLRLLGSRLPTVRRQVNEEWLGRYRGWVYGAGFGFQLGLGVATIVTVSAVYAALAAAFLSGSTAAGATVGGAFGAVRAGTALAGARVRTPRELVALDGLLRRWEAPSLRVALAAEGGILAAALALAAL